MQRLVSVAAALLALFSIAVASEGDGKFDFYVLSLSWSPTFCASDPSASDSAQCGLGASHGFVVHGLWPQYERGYPLSCGGAGRLPRALVDSMLDIMPDRGLVRHEWEVHGTCAGTDPAAYFATLRDAFEQVRLPPSLSRAERSRTLSAGAIEAAFVLENPGLSAGGIAISCKAGMLEEVRICLDRDLGFRRCREVDGRGCRSRTVLLPAPG